MPPAGFKPTIPPCKWPQIHTLDRTAIGIGYSVIILLSPLKHFIFFSIFAETSTGCLLGGSALGKRELKAEEVGRKAADELLQSVNTRACVDSYAQDQVTVKPFPLNVTKHLLQMLWVDISSLRISR